MRCSYCEREAWYRCGRTEVLVCPEHARLEVVASRGENRATPPIEIDTASDEDYPRLKELALHFWGETEVECFDQLYDVSELPAVLARIDREVVGFLSYAVESDALNIVMLNVLPEHQGIGLGKELLKTAIEEAQRRGLARVIVATSNDDLMALYFYQRAGFVIKEVVPGRIVEHHGGVELGFGGIAIRDEIRLQLPLSTGESVE